MLLERIGSVVRAFRGGGNGEPCSRFTGLADSTSARAQELADADKPSCSAEQSSQVEMGDGHVLQDVAGGAAQQRQTSLTRCTVVAVQPGWQRAAASGGIEPRPALQRSSRYYTSAIQFGRHKRQENERVDDAERLSK